MNWKQWIFMVAALYCVFIAVAASINPIMTMMVINIATVIGLALGVAIAIVWAILELTNLFDTNAKLSRWSNILSASLILIGVFIVINMILFIILR